MMIHLRGCVGTAPPIRRVFPTTHKLSSHGLVEQQPFQQLSLFSSSRTVCRRYEKAVDHWQDRKTWKAQKEAKELLAKLE